ncbi:MAG: DUF4234 domain-containing protein [Gaiellaceae bacterium]
MSTSPNTGPLGNPRGIGFGILMFIVTLGFYSWYWAFKTHEKVKQHSGEGVGGVIGLVIWILLNVVSAFVIPSEVGKMYGKDGQEPPVTGWTGLWLFPGLILIIPAIVWFVKVQGALNDYWARKAPVAEAA